MILDGFALNSLQLLPANDLLSRSRSNIASTDFESQQFSLFNTVNHCITAFGRRLLRQWICAPSCDPKILKSRQEVVQFLCTPEAKSLLEFASASFKKVPDLERLFQRFVLFLLCITDFIYRFSIHTLGLKYRSEKHPDSRAQIFDSVRYNSRKIRDLCATLTGLEQLQKLMVHFDKYYQSKTEW